MHEQWSRSIDSNLDRLEQLIEQYIRFRGNGEPRS